jgi:UDP-N-acetylmuramate dehydrogenase
MNIKHDVSLSEYSTMRLGGKAAHLTEVSSHDELAEALAWAEEQQLPAVMIGIGSNIVWSDEGYKGLVIVDKIMGFESSDADNNIVMIKIGSGENWDSVVARTVAQGLHGIESLSLIPGTAGATPVQNVGAYGQEIANTLVSVEACDWQQKMTVNIAGEDCGFGYRTSRFKTSDKGRFFITSITLKLSRRDPAPPFYRTLQDYLNEHRVTEFTPQVIRDAVIAIRTAKMPDPAKVANNGSFFHNPIIAADEFAKLSTKYPDMVNWPMAGGQVKLSAAWLVEQAGFPKGYQDPETGMATWSKQALVLVNEHAKSTADVLKFRQKIIDAVKDKFGIALQQEPEVIGN